MDRSIVLDRYKHEDIRTSSQKKLALYRQTLPDVYALFHYRPIQTVYIIVALLHHLMQPDLPERLFSHACRAS